MSTDSDATVHRNLIGSALFSLTTGLVFGLLPVRNTFSNTGFITGLAIGLLLYLSLYLLV